MKEINVSEIKTSLKLLLTALCRKCINFFLRKLSFCSKCAAKKWKIPEMVTREGSNELIFGLGASSSPVSIIIKMCFTLSIIIIYELSEKKFKKKYRENLRLVSLSTFWGNYDCCAEPYGVYTEIHLNEMKSWGHCVIHIKLTRLSSQISILFLRSPALSLFAHKSNIQIYIILVN